MRFEAIVVGGGIVGLSAAWGLVEGGLNQVLLVERRLLASGATGLGTGSVHTQRWHPTDSALILRSKRLMGEITERSSGTFQLFPVGRLTLAGRADTATSGGMAGTCARSASVRSNSRRTKSPRGSPD